MRVWVVVVEQNDSAVSVDSVWNTEAQANLRASSFDNVRWKTASIHEMGINVPLRIRFMEYIIFGVFVVLLIMLYVSETIG